MTQPPAPMNFNPAPGTTAARLFELREHILAEWVARARQSIASAKNERTPILINTLPAFLENLSEALAPNYPRELATEGSTIATEHGGERARLTRVSPDELIREFQLLRDVIFDALGSSTPLSESEKRIIVKSIDLAMSESLTSFFLVHEGLREQFSATLTHDLRNPLSAIKASADLILRHPEQPDKNSVLAVRISDNVKRIDRMVQDLLDASLVRFGEKIQFEVEPCELLSIVEEVLTQLSTVHGNRFELKGELVEGYWNRDAFRRAIENLLVNAIKYGDSSALIKIQVEKSYDRAIVRVKNEGPHIPAEDQEGVFRSFMRARTAITGEKRGWGLGLAMVRGMAEGHGGSITVDSAPGRGTTFVIDVPVDARPHLGKPTLPGT